MDGGLKNIEHFFSKVHTVGKQTSPPDSPDDSRLSEISFPSHISGLESFVDLEETVQDVSVVANGDSTTVTEETLDKYANIDSCTVFKETNSTDLLNDFLKMSSPPISTSASNQNSLDESSMSLSKLEALQANLQDSFLKSHSDDSERDKQLRDFLEQPNIFSESVSKEKITSMIDQPDESDSLKEKRAEISDVTGTPNLQMNQTELDSLFLKDVRQRLQLSNLDSTVKSPFNTADINETLRQIDEETQLKEETSLTRDLEEKLSQELRAESIEERFDRGCIEQIQRPNLDGSSSDSDDGGIAKNFARTNIHTSTLGNERFNIQQELEDLNLENIPERQLAEGGDDTSEVFNDGGGGGDGSSGHSDSDIGGDGGVSIIAERLAPAVGGERESSDDDDERIAPPSRERPVGGSGTTNCVVVTTRQVQFSAMPVIVTSHGQTTFASSSSTDDDNGQTDEHDNQDSRLSARYFLAASTPFKTDQLTRTENWLSQSSFHISQDNVQQKEDRTLVGEDFSMVTPTSATLSKLRHDHGEPPNWTFGSPTITSDARLHNEYVEKTLTNDASGVGSETGSHHSTESLQPYNPFETLGYSNAQIDNGLGFDFEMSTGWKSENFNTSQHDLEKLLVEDEKVIALNNNSVYKIGDETTLSEWSLHSENQGINSAILPSGSNLEDGRVSVYFKAKSHELGHLSGDEGPRPNFTDDSHQVITPPTAAPVQLVKDPTSIEHDQTIPSGAWSDETFNVITPTNEQIRKKTDLCETPKFYTHKRNSETVLQKKKKRQLIGNEAISSESSGQTSKLLQSTRKKSSSQEETVKDVVTPIDTLTDISTLSKSIAAPVSEIEADSLLNDIKGRRVSTVGMTKTQIAELAKCISSMTGTDINFVYKLILLLPKSQPNDLPIENLVNTTLQRRQQETSKSDQGQSIPFNQPNPMQYVKSPIRTTQERLFLSEPIDKPISSVIPLNSQNRQHDPYVIRNHNINPLNFHQTTTSDPTCYLHSTQLPDRISDPNPLTQNRIKPDQRSAVSVSPVRCGQQPYISSTGFYANKHSIMKDSYMNEAATNFQPLPPQRSSNENMTMNTFHPLQHQTSRATSNTEISYASTNMNEDYGVIYSQGRYNSRYPYSMNSSQQENCYNPDGISFPKEVVFDVCCLGMTTSKVIQFHNANNCWIQCQLHIVFFAHNGQETDTTPLEIYSLPPKITLDPHSTEDIKIKFSPAKSGCYMMKIELMVTTLIADEVNLKWQRVANVLNIEGIAEQPDLEVLLDESKSVDFGEMPYGSTRIQELKILNKGRADVPIRLSITEGTVDCTYFKLESDEKDEMTDLSSKQAVVVTGRKHAGLPMKPKIITLRFDSPSRQEKDIQQQVVGLPEEFLCHINIETDTKQNTPVACVPMKAKVGVLRLHSLRTMQAITLSTMEGQHVSRVIPLKNAGNISLRLESKIVGAASYFSVMPSIVNIKPGMQSEVKVSFKSETTISVESRLVVCVLPDGDHYEWGLKGYASQKSIVEREERPTLLCNKLALNWAGVPIGQSKQQKLVLRNNSSVEYLHFNMSIAADHSNFQIQNDSLLQQKSINKFEAVLKPGGELPVHVLFAPSCFAMMSSSLVLRTVCGSTKFVVPLSGYGGACNLDINGAKKLNDQFWIDMGEVYLGKRSVINIMLRNSGSRAAFVSLKCFSDITARLEYPNTHVTITPNNFVLREKGSEQISILYQPLQNHAFKSQEGTFTTAHLVIYSGDEVLRHQYRKNSTGLRTSYGAHTSQLLLLNSDFLNQQSVVEEMKYDTVPDWEQFFYANISKTVVAMVATPNHHSYNNDRLSIKDQLQKNIVHITPAQKLQLGYSVSAKNTTQNGEYWAVYPEQIILSASEESTASKLQLINYSDVAVAFEFIWPAQTLVITPCKDKIPAKSQLTVRINAKPSFLARQEDIPWRGSIYIQCDGQQKCVNVQIRNDVVSDQSPSLPISTQQLMPLDTHNVSLTNQSTPLAEQSVTIAPHILEFQDTKVNMVAESAFVITNKTTQPCRWFLSSIAPPYFKEQDSKGDIVRATYTAFRFAKHSGKLNAKQVFKLPVSFLPRDGGVYSQFWDFEASYEHLQSSVKARIELIGQGSCSEEKHSNHPSRKQIGTAQPILMNPRRNNDRYESYEPPDKKVDQKKGHVFIKDDCLEFPATKVGDRSELKFRLCNDGNEVQKVRVSGFRSPFSVILKHVKLSIRPKSYVRVPVYYSPTSSADGVSEGLLVLTPESGETLCVKLCGKTS